LITENLGVVTFIFPGPSTHWDRVRCTSCNPSGRSWMEAGCY